jgi:hypothetical protein
MQYSRGDSERRFRVITQKQSGNDRGYDDESSDIVEYRT